MPPAEGMRGSRSLFPARLLDLIGSGKGLGPFTAPIGLDNSRRTVWHDLHSATSRHLIVTGATADRCEAIRSVTVGLALTTRPALLQLLTIDATGRELLFLGTLPHAVLETAIDPAAARLSLGWLSEELGARRREGRPWPAILLVVDDLTALETRNNPGAARAVDHILRHGGGLGIHLLAGASRGNTFVLRPSLRRSDIARLTSGRPPGDFEYRRGKSRVRLTSARLSAWDLDQLGGGRPRTPRISVDRTDQRRPEPMDPALPSARGAP